MNSLGVSWVIQGSEIESIHRGEFHSFHLNLFLDSIWDCSLFKTPDAEENVDSSDNADCNNIESSDNTDNFAINLL